MKYNFQKIRVIKYDVFQLPQTNEYTVACFSLLMFSLNFHLAAIKRHVLLLWALTKIKQKSLKFTGSSLHLRKKKKKNTDKNNLRQIGRIIKTAEVHLTGLHFLARYQGFQSRFLKEKWK